MRSLRTRSVEFVTRVLASWLLGCACRFGRRRRRRRAGPCYPFFAFDNGTGRDHHVSLAEQAKLLKDLGYDGIGFTGTQQIPEMLKALDAQGLKMFSIYVGAACVDAGKPPYDPGLKNGHRATQGPRHADLALRHRRQDRRRPIGRAGRGHPP